MINYKNLDVEYDSVIVFDLLSNEERGKHNISSDLDSFFKNAQAPIEVCYAEKKDTIISTLNDLLTQTKKGKKYMFHFVAHGNESGIGFKHTGEFISWEDLSNILTEINEASNNTLVLNLTSCFGLHGIKSVNPFSSDAPFFGLVGYSEKLKISNGKKANQIFYDSLLNGLKINQAVAKLQSDLSDKNFHCITSQGYSYLKKAKQ